MKNIFAAATMCSMLPSSQAISLQSEPIPLREFTGFMEFAGRETFLEVPKACESRRFLCDSEEDEKLVLLFLVAEKFMSDPC